jgi:hypothetical protein
MGAVNVHEFMSIDGVIDAPTWTFEYGLEDTPYVGVRRDRCAMQQPRGVSAGHLPLVRSESARSRWRRLPPYDSGSRECPVRGSLCGPV